jgi:hypothetical protein
MYFSRVQEGSVCHSAKMLAASPDFMKKRRPKFDGPSFTVLASSFAELQPILRPSLAHHVAAIHHSKYIALYQGGFLQVAVSEAPSSTACDRVQLCLRALQIQR